MAIVNAKRGAIVNPMNLLHCAMRMPPFLSTLQCNTKNAFIVPLPDNATVRLEYDAADESKKGSCEVFGGVGRIIPEGVNAVIDVTVPVNSRLELSCAIIGSFSEPQGLLIKRGEGELDLAAVGKVRQASSNYDYYTNVEVVDGILKFPQTVSTDDAFYGTVTVRNPGILFTGKVCKNLESNRIVHLYGDGTITNDHTALCEMRVNGGEFSGVLSGMNYLSCQGNLNLLGVDSISCVDSVSIRRNYGYGADGVHGCLGILKFGLKGSVIDGAPLPCGLYCKANRHHAKSYPTLSAP